MCATKFWAVFAVGVVAGAAAALIYAPQTGEETREQIRRKYEDASDYVKDTADTIGDRTSKYVKRGKEIVNDAVDSAASAYNTARKVIPT
jgi:gas vesicle protein